MITAAIDDTPYNIVLLLHILTAFAAFAPAFVHPLLGEQTKAFNGETRSLFMSFVVRNGRRIYSPALILTGLLGFALQGMSDSAIEFSDGWIVAAILIWVVMNGILHAMILPGEKALAAGDETGESKVSIGGGAMTLLLVVMLYLMVF
ncbi:MAG: hypothetical protein ACR2QE_16355, partial [Acidimicrobiales bacterium]